MSAPHPAEPFDFRAHVAGVVDRAPSIDEMPVQHRQTIARIFRTVTPTGAERRSA